MSLRNIKMVPKQKSYFITQKWEWNTDSIQETLDDGNTYMCGKQQVVAE